MFKWKVSRLGSKKERTKQRLNNATDTTKEAEEIYVKNANNNNKERWAKKQNKNKKRKVCKKTITTGLSQKVGKKKTITTKKVGQKTMTINKGG